MCGDCQRRAVTNPLRVLDCKVPEDQPIIETLPSILDHLCEDCARTFRGGAGASATLAASSTKLRPRMVRGLDYYMRTTFEITHGALGAQNSVLGGGRYDGLAESLGSRVPAPGIGFSIGEDRLVMSVEEAHPGCVPAGGRRVSRAAGRCGRAACRRHLAAELRAPGIAVERSADRKLKRALEVANKMGARYRADFGRQRDRGRHLLN